MFVPSNISFVFIYDVVAYDYVLLILICPLTPKRHPLLLQNFDYNIYFKDVLERTEPNICPKHVLTLKVQT